MFIQKTTTDSSAKDYKIINAKLHSTMFTNIWQLLLGKHAIIAYKEVEMSSQTQGVSDEKQPDVEC